MIFQISKVARADRVGYAILFSIVLLLNGCGAWRSTPGGTGTGYDVYRPEPYLLIVQGHVDGDDDSSRATTVPGASSSRSRKQPEYTARIVWLPDYSQRYRISTGLSFSNSTIRIKDGWQLTSISTESGTSALADNVVSGAERFGTTGLGALAVLGESGQGATGPTGPPPEESRSAMNSAFGLYKIIYDRDGHVTGLVKLSPGVDLSSAQQRLADHLPPSVLPPEKPKK